VENDLILPLFASVFSELIETPIYALASVIL
jgi:hypothetical protein